MMAGAGLPQSYRRVASADGAPSSPPLLFRLARLMIRNGVRGGFRLWRWLLDAGALNRVVEYRLPGAARAAPLRVPLYREESSWSEPEIAGYGKHFVAPVIARVAQTGLAAVLIDCGADIGMITSSFVRDCALIASAIVYEPNREAFACLAASVPGWTVPVRAHNAAVGDRSGHGRLAAPPGETSAHAMFMVEDEDGPIAVRRIDDEKIPADAMVVLKIDVEGGEQAAVQGAVETLARAPAFVVIFEAHPRVAQRCGVDPGETMRLIRSVRPIDIEVAEFPGLAVDADKPFFAQLGEGRSTICNVICASR